MLIKKLHYDEVDIDLALVQHLVTTQFPHWSHLELSLVKDSGTDNVMFRLGDSMSVRLPRKADAEPSITRECTWLPKLAPHLPLAIPEPFAKGKAEVEKDGGYPFSWSICSWHEGTNASLDQITDPHQMAVDLADFITALQTIDATDGPLPKHPLHRGAPLTGRDEVTRTSIKELEGMIDTETALAVWEEALELPTWQKPPVWIHGDLHYGNLLAHNGKLTAVIDFGAMRVGDPACDLMTAWNLFTVDIRKTYRAALKMDDEIWLRGRAWALSVAVHALPYYKDSNPFLANLSRYTINEVVTDYNSS